MKSYIIKVYYDEGKALGFMQCLCFEKVGLNCKEGLKCEQNGCLQELCCSNEI
jgi:hypothetical protein